MGRNQCLRTLASALLIATAALPSSGADTASTYRIIHQFQLPKQPMGSLTMDAAGNLYGTTEKGGTTFCHGIGFGCGFVWKLAPTTNTVNPLHQFKGGDGGNPNAGLVFDAAGNLYGTTEYGGAQNGGTVFKLVPNPDGTWTESVLHNFILADGALPLCTLIFDAAGNLYGTTFYGGTQNEGTVFKLAPNPDGTWTESVLHSFTGADGARPAAGLIFDAAGNLYGTTSYGGPAGCTGETGQMCGVVFKLAPNPYGTWTESVLHSFLTAGADGAGPYAGLTFDAAGNLYGTTVQGGSAACTDGCGVVFKLALSPDGTWTESVLHRFTGGTDGAGPYAGLAFNAAGNLYGTAVQGGSPACSGGCGVVFKLTRTSAGWCETVVRKFLGLAKNPLAPVIFDGKGNLYGTTSSGSTNFGVVFEITP